MGFYNNNKIIINKCLGIIAFILGTYVFINYLFRFIAPFAVGFVFSVLLEPLCSFITKKLKIHHSLASFFCLLFLIVVIGLIGVNIVSRIIDETKSFVSNIDNYITEISYTINNLQIKFQDSYDLIPDEFKDTINEVTMSLVKNITTMLGSGVKSGSAGLVSLIPNLFMIILLSLISTFFFLKDKILISNFFKSISPPSATAKFQLIKKGLINAIAGYIKAQIILMSFTAIIAITGLLILKSPYALIAGLAIAIIDALPIFGSGFILWPWALLSCLMQNYSFALSLLVIYGVITVTRQSLEPKVLGEQIGIHPLVTLLSIYAGLKLFGVLGFLIGPATAVIINLIIKPEVNN